MSISFGETYATNAFAFVKPGKMDAHISLHDIVRSAAAYALPRSNERNIDRAVIFLNLERA